MILFFYSKSLILSKIINLVILSSYIISFALSFKWGSGIPTTILAPELIAAFIPPILSSKIIQSLGSNPKSWAASIKISGAGFPCFILLSSPKTIASISSLSHSFLLNVL